MTLGHSINSKSLDLWQKTFKDDDDVLLPLLYPSLKREAILFIGLNPSFSQKGYSSLFRDTQFSNLDPLSFYHWRNRKNVDLQIALQIEQLAKDNYRYFKKFKEIATDINLEWEHIDLFFFRETSQAQFKKRFYSGSHPSDSAKSQLELSKQLIVEANPRVIVVVNAFACSIFLEMFPNINCDKKRGYHQILLQNRSIPIFLASPLTGQRAMDNYSYKRLRWHIRQAMEENKVD
jgi:hypothetical protein